MMFRILTSTMMMANKPQLQGGMDFSISPFCCCVAMILEIWYNINVVIVNPGGILYEEHIV